MRKKLIALITISALVLTLFSGCSFNQKSVSKDGFYFDTLISITIYGNDKQEYIDECFALARECENLFSNTIDDSDVSKINQKAGKEYVEVNPKTIELIEKGIAYGQLSDGIFDITIGPLSSLWNISEISKNLPEGNQITDSGAIPSPSEIETALTHVDYTRISIKGNRVMLLDPDAKLDLGGIAKGYIADLMKESLLSNGVNSAIINLGGNILAIGSKTDGSAFNVGIQRPFDQTGASIGVIPVEDKSVVTSGVYERYFYYDNKLYHHLLDTRTGYPFSNDLLSVTIVSDSSMDGDALSTSCFGLGLEEGMKLIENTKDVEAVFITSDYTLHTSSGLNLK